MKRATRLLVVGFVVVVVGVLAIPLVNLAVGAPTATAVTRGADDREGMRPVAEILERSCANCHSGDTRRPWYGGLPFASSLVDRDIETGRRYFDLPSGLYPEGGGPTTEPTLARIEWAAVETGSMPPAPYSYAHWESRLSDEDRQTLETWVRSTRREHYAPEGLSEELAGGPIHPLTKGVEVDERRADLGETLYFDKRLSGDETISCATCHDLTKGGTDQERVSTGIRGQRGGINAPTTLNALYNLAQFWDGRAASLEAQAGGPPLNPVEMGSSWEEILGRIRADPALSARFAEAFPEGEAITSEHVMAAIAEYERTLITPDCAFDRYLLGDEGALGADARRGWELFQAHGCHTCHVGKTLGGQSYELMGRARDYFELRGGESTDADLGRFNVTKAPSDRHRFKVPILRNIALTFPYFHDGSEGDLAAAVHTMALVESGVELDGADSAAIAAFLEALTGSLGGRPIAEAPREARHFEPPAPPPPPDGGPADAAAPAPAEPGD